MKLYVIIIVRYSVIYYHEINSIDSIAYSEDFFLTLLYFQLAALGTALAEIAPVIYHPCCNLYLAPQPVTRASARGLAVPVYDEVLGTPSGANTPIAAVLSKVSLWSYL